MLMTTSMTLRNGLLWAMTPTLTSRSACVTELPQMPRDWPPASLTDKRLSLIQLSLAGALDWRSYNPSLLFDLDLFDTDLMTDGRELYDS